MSRLHLAMTGGFAVLAAQALAGLARLPWAMVPLLAAIAVLHIVLTRRRALWREPSRLAGVAALNLGVAALLYAAGRGLSLLTGAPPLSPLVVTLIALAGCALAAWAWPSPMDDAVETFTDTALRALDQDDPP